jgi:hypothetical protein
MAETVMKFTLTYDGPAVEEHELDAQIVGEALVFTQILFSALEDDVNKSKAECRVKIIAKPAPGSFILDLTVVQTLFERFKDLMLTPAVTSIVNAGGLLAILTMLIDWLRRLKGRTFKEVKEDKGDTVVIVLEDGELIEIPREFFDYLRDRRLRVALEKIIRAPLEHDGIDSVALADEEGRAWKVKRDERDYFAIPDSMTGKHNIVIETDLSLRGAQFSSGRSWPVHHELYGNISARLEDEEFAERVVKGFESFASEDRLHVRLRVESWEDKDTTHYRFFIEKVLHHDEIRQITLPFTPPSSS